MLPQTHTGSDSVPVAALVLAFDGRMFEQGLAAIESIKIHCPFAHDICVIPLDLSESQLAQLSPHVAKLFLDFQTLPKFSSAPAYAQAMTCRPWLREIFPGYELYMWIDADIRFCDPNGFEFYLRHANGEQRSVVACREIDSTYGFLLVPDIARNYFQTRYVRLHRTYGQAVADELHYLIPFNAGIFSMHRDSPIWTSYQRNLERAMQGGFDHFAEQDALNVAILQTGQNVTPAPAIMNWLCSNALPIFNPTTRRFVRPEFPFIPISVLHLTSWPVIPPWHSIPFYEIYKQRGLTK